MLHIKSHCSYFGDTGYNVYTRGFLKSLYKQYPKLSVRNFTTVDPNNITDIDRLLVDEQTVHDGNTFVDIKPVWCSTLNHTSIGDINLVLNESDHVYFYDKYDGIKIAYNMWETTEQSNSFFQKLKEFDQLWVPSEWQRNNSIQQGYDSKKIFVIPGGVDDEFVPRKKTKSNKIKFLLVGGWSYRKSTLDIIKTFLKTFPNTQEVELILSVDAPFLRDGCNSTEDRLEKHGIKDSRIKIKHITNRTAYIKLIQSADVFVSCSRGEGWNMPLLESLSCGIPSIYSNCSGQLEFTKNCPLKIKILREVPAVCDDENISFSGMYSEPDFNQLESMFLYVYNNLKVVTDIHLKLSNDIRTLFSWDNSVKKAMNYLFPLLFNTIESKNSEFCTSIGVNVNLKTSSNTDGFIYKEVFDYNVYNNSPNMKIKRGDVVVDVGAHIGIFSKYAAINGAEKVFSFEMNPMWFDCLLQNIRPIDCPFNCVILDKNFVKFKLDDDKELINGFTLNHFFTGGLFNKIDFLKIDIMGKEVTLLRSIDTELYFVINKISVKLYNLNDVDKESLLEFMKKNGFLHNLNILIPSTQIQFLYFWK